MDNKVIEVLDYMGEKLGIAIDWTSENVMPQVMEFIGRYQVYAIVENVMWTIIYIIGVAIFATILKKMFKGIKTEDRDNIWYDMHYSTDACITIAITIFLTIAIITLVVFAIDHVFNIAKWALVPEIQFFETFSSYLNSVK